MINMTLTAEWTTGEEKWQTQIIKLEDVKELEVADNVSISLIEENQESFKNDLNRILESAKVILDNTLSSFKKQCEYILKKVEITFSDWTNQSFSVDKNWQIIK